MGLAHERLDTAVDPGSIGIGERIEVKTRMGIPVAAGEVIASNPFGLVLRESGFFARDLYLFSPIEETPEPEVINKLHDDSPDGRVAAKLRSMGSPLVFEAEKLDDEPEDKGKKKDKKKEQDQDGDKEDKEPAEDDAPPIAAPTSSVDVDKLPDDIRKAIVSTTQLDSETLNSVLSEIGDTVVKSLKRASVKDTEIYGIASKVQRAAEEILTGKKSKG
jgi:hypothetical protein